MEEIQKKMAAHYHAKKVRTMDRSGEVHKIKKVNAEEK